MRSDSLNVSSGSYRKDVRELIYCQDNTTTIELAVESSGALVLLRACGGTKLINLPDASNNSGVWYDFYLHETTDGTITVQSQDGTDFFAGSIADGEGDPAAQVVYNGSSHDQLAIASGAAVSELEFGLVCDGSNWLIVRGISQDISDVSAAASSSNT